MAMIFCTFSHILLHFLISLPHQLKSPWVKKLQLFLHIIICYIIGLNTAIHNIGVAYCSWSLTNKKFGNFRLPQEYRYQRAKDGSFMKTFFFCTDANIRFGVKMSIANVHKQNCPIFNICAASKVIQGDILVHYISKLGYLIYG